MTLPIEKHKQEHIGRVLKVVEENLSGARAGNADFFYSGILSRCAAGRCPL